jgi:hypothetical protein
VERVTGRAFLGVDARAVAAARERLLDGRPVLAAIDVPADVVSRSAAIPLFGEPMPLSAGVLQLGCLTKAPIQLVVAVQRDGAIELYGGDRIATRDFATACRDLGHGLTALLRRFPDEWWLWPFVARHEMPGVVTR